MCGISGIITPDGLEKNASEITENARRMASTMIRRGPDDCGQWADPAGGIALSHRRLSIIDLSEQGHQPMHSANGRYVISYNGEVYNFRELRADLDYPFKGNSDTEVILAAIQEWGLEEAVKRFAGMFAFAVWDKQKQALHLVRDRLGIKPLYYGKLGKSLVFGSTLSPLRTHPDWQGEIDQDVLALFLQRNYIPAPYSIFQHVYKLPAGTILTVKRGQLESAEIEPQPANSLGPGNIVRPIRYWSLAKVLEEGEADPHECGAEEALESLEEILTEAVRGRLISDVPLGAFLSGGIDSTMVVALMSKLSSEVKTFTIGFDDETFNEAAYAKETASHFGTEHTELYVSSDEALKVISELPTTYDEPFADSSQIPTYLVSRLTRQHVTVALSGDGGDELFAGYNRYTLGQRLWNFSRKLPGPARSALATMMTTMPVAGWEAVLKPVKGMLPGALGSRPLGESIQNFEDILRTDSMDTFYERLTSHWHEVDELVPGSTTVRSERELKLSDPVRRMMAFDLAEYHPDDILVKVDRASMAHSLEVRVPIIDHRVVEFSARLPLSMMIKAGQGKWPLRQLLNRHIPEEMTGRPKRGFAVPVNEWIRGPMKDWAEELLNESRLRNGGFLNPAPIRKRWQEHLSGKRDWKNSLWGVLMFQAWLEAGQADPVH
ncbi:MAG: asparagine synthase (glutamine-hydrolyzing) [Planctomycetota bacterium]|jgi:asparagine synthase (glutamine-hydrolysing)|nr:asparagine synthase (glutamine-hydrolyzing) [Planctomycetota bacterium]